MMLAMMIVLPGKQVRAEEHDYELFYWDWEEGTGAEEIYEAYAVFECRYCDDRFYVEAEVTKAGMESPTCTDSGFTTYRAVVFFDGDIYTDDYDEWEAPTGHILTKTNEKQATCTEAGNSEYYTCLNCGKYIDEDATYCMDCLTKSTTKSSGSSSSKKSSSKTSSGNKCHYKEGNTEVCSNTCAPGSNFCSYHKKLLEDIYSNLTGK